MMAKNVQNLKLRTYRAISFGNYVIALRVPLEFDTIHKYRENFRLAKAKTTNSIFSRSLRNSEMICTFIFFIPNQHS